MAATDNGELIEYLGREFGRIHEEFGRAHARFDGVDGRLVAVEVGQEQLRSDLEQLAEGQTSLRESMERGFESLREEMKSEVALLQSVPGSHAGRVTALEEKVEGAGRALSAVTPGSGG